METLSGNNSVEIKGGQGTLAEIQARVVAAEAMGLDQIPAIPGENPASQTQVQDRTNPAVSDAKQSENTVDVPQQYKDKEGKLAEKRVLDANEHLVKSANLDQTEVAKKTEEIMQLPESERQERLIKFNKELLEQHRQYKVKAKEEEAKKPISPDLDLENLTPEFRDRLMKDAETDFPATMIKLAKAVAAREVDNRNRSLESKLTQIDEERLERSSFKELDTLVKEGHDWILSEGIGRINEVLKERPYLNQSKTPFRDAVRFIELPNSGTNTNGSAQAVRTSPILGANRAVPPPSSLQPVTAESEMESLSIQFNKALAGKNKALANELLAKMEILEHSR